VALKSDLDEVYFCKYPSSALLETQSDEKVLSYKELADPMLLSNPSAIYAGNGWDDERIKLDASSIVNIHSDALSIAYLAELKINNQDKFLPEDANPVYLKDTNYKKISNE
jgi:tRNA A37 threonylcarbamoyladenosine modification protein TsaB